MTIFRSYKNLQEALINNKTSCVEVTKSYILEIKKKEKLNVFIEVFAQEALELAKKIDEKIKKGSQGRF